MSHDKMANLIGISVSTLENYKMLEDMIPELDDLVTAGIVTKTINPQQKSIYQMQKCNYIKFQKDISYPVKRK